MRHFSIIDYQGIQMIIWEIVDANQALFSLTLLYRDRAALGLVSK